jgi:outer membrane protein assembly factor BamB
MREAKMARFICGALAALLLSALLTAQQSAPVDDWLTWGYDQQRTGWNRAETMLNKENVAGLQLKWRTQLDIVPKDVVLSTSTAPLVAQSVITPQGSKDLVFVLGSNDTVYSIDAATGNIVWKKNFPNSLKPVQDPTYLCPNTANTTPVIDKQASIIYLITSDGKLRGLSLANGAERMAPTDFVPPHARTWSLNLIDGVIYTPVARGCGRAVSNFTAMDIRNPAHPIVKYNTSTGRPAGAWGLGGMVLGPKGLYAQTADGPYDPAAGKFGDSLLVMDLKDLQLVDSFTPGHWQMLNTKDLDLGSASPVVFPFQKWQLVAGSSKEAVIYLLDADAIGGTVDGERNAAADHHTPLHASRWANDEQQLWGRGVWGAMATWEDAQGGRWLVVPMWGAPSKASPKFEYSYGAVEKGSVMAFKLAVQDGKPTLIPAWMSRDMHVPEPPAIANGVVYVIATGENTRQGGFFLPEVRAKPVDHAILYAFDATTGRELYSSGDLVDSWTHFNGPAVAKGRVYFTTHDGKVYAFGLK